MECQTLNATSSESVTLEMTRHVNANLPTHVDSSARTRTREMCRHISHVFHVDIISHCAFLRQKYVFMLCESLTLALESRPSSNSLDFTSLFRMWIATYVVRLGISIIRNAVPGHPATPVHIDVKNIQTCTTRSVADWDCCKSILSCQAQKKQTFRLNRPDRN